MNGTDKSAHSSDAGFTLTELVIVSVLGAVIAASALAWLVSTIRNSDIILESHEDDRELGLTLDAIMAEISRARPTALCLDPSPRGRTEPVTSESSCNEVGENWGYWTSANEFRAGGPLHEAKADSLCYFAHPADTVIDLAAPVSPWGACIEMNSMGQVVVKQLEPENAAITSFLAAAIPANYNWDSGNWTQRPLGVIDLIEFSYHDFEGHELALDIMDSSGEYKMNAKKLKDVSRINVMIKRTQNNLPRELLGTLSFSVNGFSPCQEVHTSYIVDNATTTTGMITTTVVGQPTCPPASPAPTGQTAAATSDSVTLTWDLASDSDVKGYEYQIKKKSDIAWGPWTAIPGSDATTTSYTVDGLSASTEYQFMVRAVNDVGDGGAPFQLTKTTTAVPPPARPTGLAVTAGICRAELTWNSPSDAGVVTGYEFQTRPQVNGGAWSAWTRIPDSGSATTSYAVERLASGTEYRFKLRAVGVGGASGAAPAVSPWYVSATPTAGTTKPARPAGLTATAGGGSVELAWDLASPSCITRYEYRVRQAPPGPGWGQWIAIADSDATTTSHTVTGLTGGTEYRFKLRAVGNGRNGPAAPATSPWYVIATPT